MPGAVFRVASFRLLAPDRAPTSASMIAPPDLTNFLVVGAGAAGLMAARELARAGKRVTIVEARDRCGGRIDPLPTEEFGYPAEGGAEFVHGAAPVTRALMREAGTLVAAAARARDGAPAPVRSRLTILRFLTPTGFIEALQAVEVDLPIADFLETHFAGRQYDELRRSITRTVRGLRCRRPIPHQHLCDPRRMDGPRRRRARADRGRLWRADQLSRNRMPQAWCHDPSRRLCNRHRRDARPGLPPAVPMVRSSRPMP